MIRLASRATHKRAKEIATIRYLFLLSTKNSTRETGTNKYNNGYPI